MTNLKTALALCCGLLSALTSVAAIRAATPVPRDSPWWKARHAEKLAELKSRPPTVVFLGDSITHFWNDNKRGLQVWNRYFTNDAYRAVNLGFSGDRTEHVLWRIANGELDGYSAKAVVLMIGTNNAGQLSAGEEPPIATILGIRAVIDAVREKQPRAKIVLHPIFPRGLGPDDPVRRRNETVNKTIMDFADGRTVVWCDFNDQLLAPDGTILREVMEDRLHPGQYGYLVWANAVLEPLNAILFGDPRAAVPSRFAASTDPRRFHRSDPAPTYGADRFCRVRKSGRAWWGPRLRTKQDEIADAGGAFDLVLLGDSITHNWEIVGAESYATLTNSYRTLNLGFSGDAVQHLLWRLENGELEGYRAKLFMLMIGTNNSAGDPAITAAGIGKVVGLLRDRHPESQILLLPIFPRQGDGRAAQANEAVSAALRCRADGGRIRWLDFNEKFLKADGTPNAELYFDSVHPNARGYRIWLDAIRPVLSETCGK